MSRTADYLRGLFGNIGSREEFAARALGLEAGGPDEARRMLRHHFSREEMRSRTDATWREYTGYKGGMSYGGAARLANRGFWSAFLPIEPFGRGSKFHGSNLEGWKSGRVARAFGPQVGVATGRTVGNVFKWIGPVIAGARILQGDPIHRVIAEEGLSTAVGVTAMAAGSSIAAGAGLGAAAGPVGLVVGAVAGMAAHYVGGKMVDAAEVPVRVAHEGYKQITALGRRQRRLELGGQVSKALQTRAAHTMRQRSLQQMTRSGINARSILGREATYMALR
jgi:hypothetical protein